MTLSLTIPDSELRPAPSVPRGPGRRAVSGRTRWIVTSLLALTAFALAAWVLFLPSD